MSSSVKEDPFFQALSSPLGNSPFDGGLANRDKIVSGYVALINTNALALDWGAEIQADGASVFPGLGNFGPGGGPDSLNIA